MFQSSVFDDVPVDKSVQVVRITWKEQTGAAGSAWIDSRKKIRTITKMLKDQGATDIHVETHYIPRIKTEILEWLKHSRVQAKPDRIEVVM